MPLVAGVDSSTQSTKVEIRDADSGELVASGRAPHPATTPPRSEQHPSVWFEAMQAALARTGAERIGAIAVAGQQHGMVVLDSSERVVRPAKLWNDTESAPQAAALVDRLGAEAWARACGSVPTAAFTVTKLAWLRENEPDAWARVAHVLLPHDWLTFRLTGERTTDRGDASGTGYWGHERWQHEVLALVGLDERALPRVLGPSDAAGVWQGAVVGPGTGDNMAAALALGLQPGDVAVSIGTSGTVYAVTARPAQDASGAVAGFADATGRHLPLVCTLNATKVTDAVARLLGVTHTELDALALTESGAPGPVLVPYLDGERTPNRPDATGTLRGLRSDVSREQLARAAYQGVVCGLLDGLDALCAAGVPSPQRLVLVGGGARSAAYRRVLADLSQLPVDVPAAEELVAAGACVQADAVYRGARPQDVAEDWALAAGDTLEPDAAADAASARATYAAARDAV